MVRVNDTVMVTKKEYDSLQSEVAKDLLFNLRDQASPKVMMLMTLIAASMAAGIRDKLFGNGRERMRG